ncbi:MAG TPA: DNA repair protein RadC [Candidatus Binatia bacterium]|nr:DNA repair protein RadC [Candidatus Binatia bacterium]
MLHEQVSEDCARDRVERAGVESLTDAELLSLVLGRGRSGVAVAAVVRRLRARYPDLEDLAAASLAELAAVAGVGPARAAAIGAAVALGRRVDHRSLAPGEPIGGSADVHRHFHPRLAALRQERFYVVLLDGKGRLMREVRVSEGSLTASLVHPREVFRFAIREAAASVILVHNHPSGDPDPSPEDVTLTARLRSAGDLLGIRVLDHVVIGRGRWASFADLGKL